MFWNITREEKRRNREIGKSILQKGMIVNKNMETKHYRPINFPYNEMETLLNSINAYNPGDILQN